VDWSYDLCFRDDLPGSERLLFPVFVRDIFGVGGSRVWHMHWAAVYCTIITRFSLKSYYSAGFDTTLSLVLDSFMRIESCFQTTAFIQTGTRVPTSLNSI
jgi:hypothetical protein